MRPSSPGLEEPDREPGVVPSMRLKALRPVFPVFMTCIALAACGSMGPSSPLPPGPTPVPQPKPGPVVPAELSQADAEATCLVQGARKFGLALADVSVSTAKPVDAGYLVRLNAAGSERTCIIAKDGFIRSLR